MASQASTGVRSPSGVPGRGLRKLSGTSVGPSVLQLDDELDPLGIGLAHAEEGAAAQLHARISHQSAGVAPLLPAVGGDDRREEGSGCLEVVVVAVHTTVGQPPGLLVE